MISRFRVKGLANICVEDGRSGKTNNGRSAMFTRRFGLVLFLCLTSRALGQITVPGADGSDGAFNPASNVTVNLALAPTGTWDGSNPNPGLGIGVYDPDKWAVVFRYSSVNIASGRTVSFSNHPSGAPVVWLVDGPVTINGAVSVSRPPGATSLGFAIPGPGGFRGAGTNPTGGLGPGGGEASGAYATGASSYGNSRVVPLIGGSGGGFGYGGAPGGAILVASGGIISINGSIAANGENLNPGNVTGGSGGGIRIIGNRLEGTGSLTATNNSNNYGRVRIEVNELAFADAGPQGQPHSTGLPSASAQLWPEDVVADPPSTRVVSFGSNNVPADPLASFEFPYADVNTATSGAQTLTVECKNVPTGLDPVGVQAWVVKARIVPRSGTVQNITASYVSGTYAQSTWEAQVTLPTGFSAIQVRASMPPQ